MKLLFSGYHNPHFLTITEYLENAIVALGHELRIFDDRCHVIPGRIRKHISWMDKWDSRYINKKLILCAKESRPDVALISGGHRIKADTLKTIKSMGIRTVLWTIDAPLDFEPLISAAPEYDYIFCQGTEANELFKKEGIEGTYWLPMACDPLYHHPDVVSDREKELYQNDLVFVGSYYPNRAELLEELTGFDLGIWGPGWERIPGGSPLRKHIRGYHLNPETWIKIYTSSNVVLVIHYQDINNRIPVYQASPKLFEAMACGAFVISDNQPDVLKLFKERIHLEVYSDIDDLKQKIIYYLEHPSERLTIARRGKQAVISNHTYCIRIDKMISIIGQNCDE